jgi:hypothetical protein
VSSCQNGINYKCLGGGHAFSLSKFLQNVYFFLPYFMCCSKSRHSSVGIGTGCGLGDQISVTM